MKRRWILVLALCLMMAVPLIQAQDIAPQGPVEDTDAMISWPPPVYTLRGEIDFRGSANVDGMVSYFIEFRPLDLSDTAEDTSATRPWFPATLPTAEAVEDGILGTWNTQTAADGLYEIRLTVNAPDGARFFRVSPLRVENNPPPFVTTDIPVVEAQPSPTPITQTRPTLAPSPTPLNRAPTVTARLDANVRAGDDTSYEVIGYLLAGETVEVLGVSSFGTGWYYIQVESGRRGFIAPSVVTASGDLSRVPAVDPPPPPTPIATATPIPAANLHFVGFSLDPAQPTCGVAYTVTVVVENNGTAASTSGGTIAVVDQYAANGTVQQSSVGTFPPLAVGQRFTVEIPITTFTYFNEGHVVRATIDSNNQIPESTENDNISTISYTLQQGSCG